MGVRLRNVNSDFLDNIGVLQSWFIGLMGADGCVFHGNRVSFSQSGEAGRQLVQDVANILEYKHPLDQYKNSFAINFSSKKIYDRLGEYGIVPRKSLIYTFPEKISAELYKPFIRGYMDGDGFVGSYNVGQSPHLLVIGMAGTEPFLSRCQEIIPATGHLRKMTAKNIYDLRFNGKQAIAFGQWLWEDNHIPRYTKQKKFETYMTAHGSSLLHEKYRMIREDFFRLLGEGWSVKDISTRLGIRFQTLYAWRAKHGKH